MELQAANWNTIFTGFLILGMVLFALMRGLRYFLPVIFKDPERHTLAGRIFPVVELVLWILFFSWYVFRFAEIRSYYTIAVFAAIFIILVWVSRFFFKDLIAGIVFRASGKFSVGDMIKIGKTNGKIKKFRWDALEIESQDNKVIYLPYNKLIEQTAIKSESTDQSSAYSFLLEMKKEDNEADTIQRIKSYLLSMPWGSVKKGPEVIVREQSANHYLIEITVFPLDKQYSGKIESLVFKKFGKEK
ncbi:MAG: mechanosensitive ion channel family protein [Bacteroidales bacterium]|nr:mechanosensitive ion channel family protein [Bacteroidales bacterium]MCF8404309.1 mechanosensitive ion channel family protein [Bacteroidales bacterium]